ncbi:MAG: hypothetical protein CME70_18995 [Halobacteriovorax sp.]|nr:hypothetical protein [Halobacteriovorax sp.]|tara:strand:+ start:1057 stop:1956 length:900 start_codon:yes stop_codon:yes gene_type:complete
MSFWARLFGTVSKKEFDQFVNDQKKKEKELVSNLKLLKQGHVDQQNITATAISELYDDIDELGLHDISDIDDRLMMIEKEVYGHEWDLLNNHDGIALCGRGGVISADNVIELLNNSKFPDIVGLKSKYNNLLYTVYTQPPNSTNRILFSPSLEAPVDLSWCGAPSGVSLQSLFLDPFRFPIPEDNDENIEIVFELEYWNTDDVEHKVKKYIFLSTPDTIDSYFWNAERLDVLKIRIQDFCEDWCPDNPEDILTEIIADGLDDFWVIDDVEYTEPLDLIIDYFEDNCSYVFDDIDDYDED